MLRWSRPLYVVLAVLLAANVAEATNTPCSGSKGGVAGCRGDTFICNDGSVSASRKSCAGYLGAAAGLLGGTSPQMTPAAVAGECSCRSGAYCAGPRGGRYCMTDEGRKSYLRK
ncbi:hypothetical protein ELH77_12515 [Rhizobium ruizarguesonis]|nr:hypothetical protein ELH77_12515 [Rhizobium ruizarguesonis]